MLPDRIPVNILFSCVGQEKSDYNPFVSDHAVTFIVKGSMQINEGNETQLFNAGDFVFVCKNQLIKTTKIPAHIEPFTSISIILPKDTLFSYSKEFKVKPKGNYIGKPNFTLDNNRFLEGYLKSMLPYFDDPSALTENLAVIKTEELIEILIKDVRLQNILFNFEDEFKLDLEAYMNKKYMHNIPIENFAQLTGRSLSTFKRDFQAIFNTTPNKWLIKKRLDLAHYLITKKGSKPSEVYLETGFVNFSHFSKSFKEEFGINPSELIENKSSSK